ncbi:uncharacterized protein LOC119661224 isoform X2 [Hermetia illucens]|uniref:uncharacterized protein LOC119661224 isoform X2 n=1 Tax=Hermetia illucens TaxID=343691 RepID=UPI0018CC2A36|nr:uncharacterized protein LOC119661224 isoform X2 [Hermetia illucens]
MKFLAVFLLVAFFAGIEGQFLITPGYDFGFPYNGFAARYFSNPGFVDTRVLTAPTWLAGEGKYVAKTLGAEHVAPLKGHLKSTVSLNVDPAPGTL